MKKHIAIFVSALFIVLSTNAQILVYDGETVIPDFWDFGGNPPNGASSPPGEGWRLNVSGKMDILTEGLVNPFSTGLNTTEKSGALYTCTKWRRLGRYGTKCYRIKPQYCNNQ